MSWIEYILIASVAVLLVGFAGVMVYSVWLEVKLRKQSAYITDLINKYVRAAGVTLEKLGDSLKKHDA